MLKVHEGAVGGVTVLGFEGEFDAAQLRTWSGRIEAHLSGEAPRLVFDLAKLAFIDSSALGYLLKVKKLAAEKGGDLVLAAPSKFLLRSLTILGMQEVFSIHATAEEGAASLAGGGA